MLKVLLLVHMLLIHAERIQYSDRVRVQATARVRTGARGLGGLKRRCFPKCGGRLEHEADADAEHSLYKRMASHADPASLW